MPNIIQKCNGQNLQLLISEFVRLEVTRAYIWENASQRLNQLLSADELSLQDFSLIALSLSKGKYLKLESLESTMSNMLTHKEVSLKDIQALVTVLHYEKIDSEELWGKIAD